MVECWLPKPDVVGSTPITRFCVPPSRRVFRDPAFFVPASLHARGGSEARHQTGSWAGCRLAAAVVVGGGGGGGGLAKEDPQNNKQLGNPSLSPEEKEISDAKALKKLNKKLLRFQMAF